MILAQLPTPPPDITNQWQFIVIMTTIICGFIINFYTIYQNGKKTDKLDDKVTDNTVKTEEIRNAVTK